MRRSTFPLFLAALAVAVSALPAAAEHPAFAPIEDDPALPRVLLLGDSISIGYTLPVRRLLAGKANVHRPPENCLATTYGLEKLDAWLGEGKWDVIHFNWGLHDLKYLGPDGRNLADPEASDSRQQVPPEQYAENLRALVRRLKQTGATLIWRTTTPVPPGAQGRVVGDAAKYNGIAAAIMAEEGVATHDLYRFVQPRMKELMLPANVHFKAHGNRQLAQEVAAALEQALAAKKP